MTKTKFSILIITLMMSFLICIGVRAEFTESVNTVMIVRTASGKAVDSPEELTAGEYNVILNIGNLSSEAKQINVYVAVKSGDNLYSVKTRAANLENKELMQIYPIEIPVTLSKDVLGKEISIEAYCWDDTMVPFNRKTVFGEAKTEIYTAYGRITATRRSNYALDYGEVKFNVEKSDNFDGVEYGNLAQGASQFNMYYANEEAYNEMFRYSKATIMKNVETDEFTIVSLEYADGDNTTITNCSLYEDGSFAGNEISFYVNDTGSTTRTYDLSDYGGFYVNGVQVSRDFSNISDYVYGYISGNDSGKVTLIDATESGKTTTDGKIDYIFVDYYVDATIGEVVDGDTYNIYFNAYSAAVKTLKIDTTDTDVKARYILDGEEISHTDLKSDDVVSIAYDVTGEFEYSTFYDMLVSRDVVSGKVTKSGADNNDREYFVINDQKYQPSKLGPVAWDTLTIGTDYILWLNVFGKFVDYDEDFSAKNIGIFDKASIDSSDTPTIRIITKDGEKVSYPVLDKNKSKYNAIASQFYQGTVGSSALQSIENLLCEYTLNSSGEITAAWPLNDVDYRDMAFEYKASTNKLGLYTLSEETKIIDLTSKSNNLTSDYYDISKVNAIQISDLIDGNEYEVICAGKSYRDGIYRYVVLLSGETNYVEPEDKIIGTYAGIFNGASIDSSNTPRIKIITKDGEIVSYPVKGNSKSLYNEIRDGFYNDNTLKPIAELLCEYSITSKGYIASAVPFDDVSSDSVFEYESGVNKIGEYSFREDAVILDLTSVMNDLMYGNITKVHAIKHTDLIAGQEYEFMVADKQDDGSYKYIVLLWGDTAYVEPEDEIVGTYIGIFDKASIDSSDTPKIRIITQDGEKISYSAQSKSEYNEIKNAFYYNDYTLKSIEQLLCEYSVTSKGYITAITPLGGVGMATGEYDPETKAFGPFELAEGAVILDLSSKQNSIDTDYNISVINKKDFEDLVEYATYKTIVADENENGKFGFAILLTDAPAYTAKTPIAVYNASGSVYDDYYGTAIQTLEVYSEGNDEIMELKLEPGFEPQLSRGDVFVYETNSNGYVNGIIKIFASVNADSYSNFMYKMTPENMRDNMITSNDGFYSKSVPALAYMPDEWICTDSSTRTGEVDLVYGVITDKNGQNVSLAPIEEIGNDYYITQGVRLNSACDYAVLDDANVYIYDYSERKAANRLSVGTVSSISKSMVHQSEWCMDAEGSEYYTVINEQTGEYRELNFMFAKLVDGDIAECLVISGCN